ncbi:hypothetical protein F444_08990 [Phytophthora nicotianae P1976]|nr:hypothetical protein F444_08990 [Phytophthora nicotianae P1976]
MGAVMTEVVKLFPHLNINGVFFLFAGLCCICGIFVYFFCPETKGLMLEDIEVLFHSEQPKSPAFVELQTNRFHMTTFAVCLSRQRMLGFPTPTAFLLSRKTAATAGISNNTRMWEQSDQLHWANKLVPRVPALALRVEVVVGLIRLEKDLMSRYNSETTVYPLS